MTTVVTDVSGNRNDKIYNAAKVLERSKDRRKVFAAIYRGKKKVKTVTEVSDISGLTPMRVLQEGQKLFSEDLVGKIRIDGETAYEKKDFYSQHYRKILSYAVTPKKLEKLPTKVKLSIQGGVIKVPLVKKLVNIKRVTIQDIDSFSRVRTVNSASRRVMAESVMKKGLQAILGETGKFQDWGGENCDLFSRLKIGGRMLYAAFALKGKATTGMLTPGKMGKNGDQIQRLFNCPADVFIIMYHGQVAENVMAQMQTHAIATSIRIAKKIYFGIIENNDTAKLVAAYSDKFH
jgi:hypothetical protein